METIGEQNIFSFGARDRRATARTCTEVRKGEAHRVKSFMELARKIAELQFMNRDFVLLFRGQKADYRNRQKNTSLKPSLLRGKNNTNPEPDLLKRRFRILEKAERRLAIEYSKARFLGRQRLKRQKILRWSILQHYEICDTPLLDVTHSLRIAASFASHGASREAFVFVLGVPNLSGAITASAEAGLQMIRLSSVCPPSALRPHIQEGYLLGEYPEMSGYDQKQQYDHYEVDFGRRLVAKFMFDPRTFWESNAFPLVGRTALYPNQRDRLFRLAQPIEKRLRAEKLRLQ